MNRQTQFVSVVSGRLGPSSVPNNRPRRKATRKHAHATSPYAPSWEATLVILATVVISGLTLRGESPSGLARYAACWSGCGLAAVVLLELRHGWRSIFRADLLVLAALYFLTLFEFLFDQPMFNTLLDVPTTERAIAACLTGLAGLAVGRHLAPVRSLWLTDLLQKRVSPGLIIFSFCFCLIGGFLYMLVCVSWNPLAMVNAMVAPRFSQPWTRGQFGDWKALLYETSMLIYLIPPLAAVVLARRAKYSGLQIIIVSAGLLFVLFYGFSSGTRNLFATYLVTSLAAYVFALPRSRRSEAFWAALTVTLLFLLSCRVMLEFRGIGFKNYVSSTHVDRSIQGSEFYVDYDLWAIGTIVGEFPEKHDYLGAEIVYNTLIRPIPRAMWSGKPEGLSVSIEEMAGVEGMTMACTFVGEAYMSGGIVVVFLFGCLFGMAARWWDNQVGTVDSNFGILVYASGLFAIAISMRSMQMFTTAILPTIGAILLGMVLAKRSDGGAGFS